MRDAIRLLKADIGNDVAIGSYVLGPFTLAGQIMELNDLVGRAGMKQVTEQLSLVTFMEYDSGHFDAETRRLEPIDHPFSPKVLPMSPE